MTTSSQNNRSNMVSSLGLANDPDNYVLTPRTAHKYKSVNQKYETILKTSPPPSPPPAALLESPLYPSPVVAKGFPFLISQPAGGMIAVPMPLTLQPNTQVGVPVGVPVSVPITVSGTAPSETNDKPAEASEPDAPRGERKRFRSKPNLSVVIPEPTTKPLLPMPIRTTPQSEQPPPVAGLATPGSMISPGAFFSDLGLSSFAGDLNGLNGLLGTPVGAFTPTTPWSWQSPRQSYSSPRPIITPVGEGPSPTLTYDPLQLGLSKVNPISKKPKLSAGDGKEG